MLSKLLKRLHTLIKAMFKSIEMSKIDILFSGANLKSKEGRRIYMRCIKMIPGHFRYILNKNANFTPLKVSNEWGKIGKYKTKSFGEVDFSYIAEILGVDIRHYKHQIHLDFSGDYINQKIVDTCLHAVDNYFEINSVVKQTMLSTFQENKYLHNFFKCCYNIFPRYESVRIFGTEEFKMINLENVVKKLNYPDISFTVDKNNLTINFWYHFKSTSAYAKGNALIVTMNEQLDILKFEHAEHLIS
jgi:hypothetical protein